jgi:protein ATS1
MTCPRLKWPLTPPHNSRRPRDRRYANRARLMHLFAAGSNAKGQLATGDDEDAHEFKPCKFFIAGKAVMEAPGSIVKVVAGANHSIALLEDPAYLGRSLWGAGDGSKGQLGPQFRRSTGSYHVYHPLDIPLPNEKCSVQDACAAWETSFVRVRDGTTHRDYILSFGSNDHGLLGVAPGITPHDVNTVNLPTSTGCEGTKVALFATGPRNAYAVINNLPVTPSTTVLVGWGASRHGQLTVTSGSTDTTQPKHPASTSTPQLIDLPQDMDIESITGGFQHALALTTVGRLLGLGSNNKGQLNLSNLASSETGKPLSIGSTWNSSFILDESRRSFVACGSNNHGQLGGVVDSQSLVTVSLPERFVVDLWVCGSEHVLVLARSVRAHLCIKLLYCLWHPPRLIPRLRITEMPATNKSYSAGDGTNTGTWDSDIRKTWGPLLRYLRLLSRLLAPSRWIRQRSLVFGPHAGLVGSHWDAESDTRGYPIIPTT